MTPSAQQRSDTAVPVDTSRRSRKGATRRDHVYACAVALFIEQGYDETTMDHIAERADVARATVFNYFPRKLEFIHEWSVRRREDAVAAVLATPPDHYDVSEILIARSRW
jgi:AcrR family transcriptional regulator